MSTDWLNDCSQMRRGPIPKARPREQRLEGPARARDCLHPFWSILRGRFAAPSMRLAQGRLGRDSWRRITLEWMEMRLNWRRNAIELTTHRRLRGAFLGPVRLARVGFLRRSMSASLAQG